MTLKFSQITASLSNFTTTDVLLGVQSATADRLFSFNQIASGLLTSATLSGATLNTATLNNVTINTALVNGWLGVGTTTPASRLDVGGEISTKSGFPGDTQRGSIALGNYTSVGAGTVGTIKAFNVGTAVAQIDFGVTGTSFGNLLFYTFNGTTPTAGMSINASAIVVIGTAQITNILSPTINTATINNSLLNTAVLVNATINTATITDALINPTNATAGYVLRSNGTVLAPTWAGGKTLLNTLTASNVASTTDTTSLTSQYPLYQIEFDVTPISTATLTTVLAMQLSTSGGATWLTTNNYCTLQGSIMSATFTVGAQNGTQILLGGGLLATTAIHTGGFAGLTGSIEMTRSARVCSITGQIGWLAVTNEMAQVCIAAQNVGFIGTLINGMAFYMSTGTISGTIRIYGIS